MQLALEDERLFDQGQSRVYKKKKRIRLVRTTSQKNLLIKRLRMALSRSNEKRIAQEEIIEEVKVIGKNVMSNLMKILIAAEQGDSRSSLILDQVIQVPKSVYFQFVSIK